jgi:hypothetical protein
MEEAVAESGLTFAEIGEGMDVDPGKNPANTVRKLLRESPDPGIIMLLRFSKAVAVSL